MRHFALFIDNEVRGPLSEYEVQDLISAGTATAETLCAPAGSTAWEPLSNHFTFGSTLKLNRGPAVERTAEESTAQANRLDPEVRRNLLMYGLADAATVDQFAPAQAEAALAARIAEIQSGRRRHQFAGLGAFLTALALGAYLGLALVVVCWVLTAGWSVPCHRRLRDEGPASPALDGLIRSHRWRTALWTLTAIDSIGRAAG